MSILFVSKSITNPLHGGVERVTYVIASYLRQHNIPSYYLSITNNEEYRDKYQYVLPNPEDYNSYSNLTYIKELISNLSIKIIINQGGLSPFTSNFSYIFKRYNINIISVVHSTLLGSINNFPYTYSRIIKTYKLSWTFPILRLRIIKSILLRIYKYKYRYHYLDLCKNSNFVVLLSKEYIKELNFFTHPQIATNVINIGNPCSFCTNEDLSKKTNTILYVGRLDIFQKKVDFLLYIWQKICHIRPNWRLKILGDGPDMLYLKELNQKLSLINIDFVGFCDPRKFYTESSILCMTSAFEGFPMVLPEAMNHGCIPIAFNSFSSINEIIDDGKNGLLVTPFEIKEYINKLLFIIDNNDLRYNMAHQAHIKSKEFSIENIGHKWLKLITNISEQL